MVTLTDLGFSKGAIVETIVSTYNVDGKPNAAPMGAIMANDDHIIVRLFNSSQTCKNFIEKKCAVVNITTNVDLFYRTAFKEVNPGGIMSTQWFASAETVNAPKLRAADAIIEISIESLFPISPEKTEATCYVKFLEALNVPPKAYNRALSATIEAIVDATRIQVFAKDERRKEQIDKLLLMIKSCREIVDKTAPNSCYSETIEDLMKRIDLWIAHK